MVTGQIPVLVLEKGLDRQNHELMEKQQQLESVLVLMQEGRLAFMAIPLPSPSLLLLSPLFLPSLPLPFSHKPDKPHKADKQEKSILFDQRLPCSETKETRSLLYLDRVTVQSHAEMRLGMKGVMGFSRLLRGNSVRHSFIPAIGQGKTKVLDLLYIHRCSYRRDQVRLVRFSKSVTAGFYDSLCHIQATKTYLKYPKMGLDRCLHG